MKPRIKIRKGNIRVINKDLLDGQFKTYLSTSLASGSGTLTVDDISGIAVSNYLLIGNFGDPDAEIVTVHASTAPSGSTVTLAANTTKAHTESDPVTVIDYNQVEYSRATTSGGAKSTLATQAINATLHYSVYNDTTNTTGYAYARFKNSGATTYSEYSVEVPYGGYDANTVGRAVEEVSDELRLMPDYDMGIVFTNECLEDINNRKRKWSPKKKLGYIIGQTSRLSNNFTMPTDVRNPYDGSSVIELRLGDEDNAMVYLDYQQFKYQQGGLAHTTVSTEASANDTTLVITNSYDFDDSGTVYVEGQTTGITYTGNTESTGTLTGVPASGDGYISATLSAGNHVWQDYDEGEPYYWTVNQDGEVEVYPLPDSEHVDKNVYMDYYQRVTVVDDLADTIKVGWYNAVKSWLRWKFRAVEENGSVASVNDPDFQRYEAEVNRMAKFDKGDKFFAFRNVRDRVHPDYSSVDDDILND